MYRAVALRFLESGLEITDANAGSLLETTRFDIAHDEDGMKIFTDGRDVTDRIRARDVTRMSSVASALPTVRRLLVNLQRTIAERETLSGGGVIAEGRDIGTVVFPHADVKIFLEAESGERARRRLAELGGPVSPGDEARIEADLRERDERDRSRTMSPLRRADDAFVVDTTNLTPEEQLARIESIIREHDSR